MISRWHGELATPPDRPRGWRGELNGTDFAGNTYAQIEQAVGSGPALAVLAFAIVGPIVWRIRASAQKPTPDLQLSRTQRTYGTARRRRTPTRQPS